MVPWRHCRLIYHPALSRISVAGSEICNASCPPVSRQTKPGLSSAPLPRTEHIVSTQRAPRPLQQNCRMSPRSGFSQDLSKFTSIGYYPTIIRSRFARWVLPCSLALLHSGLFPEVAATGCVDGSLQCRVLESWLAEVLFELGSLGA